MAHNERLKYGRGKKAFGPYRHFLKIHSNQVAGTYALLINDIAQQDCKLPRIRPTPLIFGDHFNGCTLPVGVVRGF